MEWETIRRDFAKIGPREWEAIFEGVYRELEMFLSCKIEHERLLKGFFGRGFCVDINCIQIKGQPITFSWRGILGATIVGDDEAIHISTTLFFYINQKRVETHRLGN